MKNSTRSKSRTLTNPQEKKSIQNEENENLNIGNQIETNQIEVGPNQIMILISRLRQERDELRCAVKFLNVEQNSLIKTHEHFINQLNQELQKKERINQTQLNELVLTLALVKKNELIKKNLGLESLRSCNSFENQDLMQIEHVERLELSIQDQSRSKDLLSSQTQVNELNETELHSQSQTHEHLIQTKDIEIQSIQQDLSVSQFTVTAQQSTINNLEEEVTKLETQVIEHQTYQTELENDLVSLKSKLEEKNLVNSKNSNQDSTNSLIEELNQTKTNLNETFKTVSELKEVQLLNEITLEEIETHCAKLCVELEEKTKEFDQLEIKMKSKEKEIEEIKEQHELIKNDLIYQLDIKSIKVETLENEKKVRCEGLKDGILELKNGIEEIKSEEEKLTNQLDLHEDLKFKLEERSEKLSKDLIFANQEIESLKCEKEINYNELKFKNDELIKEIQEILLKNQKLDQQLNSHEEHNQQLEMIRNELSNQLAISTVKLNDLQNEKEESMIKMNGRIRELSAMVDELRNQNESLIHLPDLIDQINSQHERMQNELKDKLNLLTTQLNHHQIEKDELHKELEIEIEIEKKRVKELENLMKSSKEIEDFNQLTFSNDLIKVKKEFESLRESMIKIEKEKEKTCTDLQLEIQLQKTRVKELENELKSTRETLDVLKQTGLDDLDQARVELKGLRESMTNSENEKEESCSALQLEIQVQKKRVEELEAELKSTREALDLNQTASEDLVQARAELEGLRESMTNLENEKEESCSTLQLKIQAQKTKVEELEAELLFTKETLDLNQTASEDLVQARVELEGLRESMTNLENEKEERCLAFQVEIQALKTRVEELETGLKSTCETLDMKKTALEDLDQTRAELEVLRESMRNLENEKEESCLAFQSEIQTQKTRVKELETELKSNKETLDLNQGALEDLDQARAELEVLRESMTKVENEKEERCSTLQLEIQAQKTKVEELETELKSTRETSDSNHAALEDLNQARVELELLRDSMTNLENEKEERCLALQVEMEAQKIRVEELETELLSTKETLNSSQRALEDLNQARVELELLRNSSDSQSRRYNEAKLELERLRLEIVDLKVQQGLNDELAKEFDVLVAEFELHHTKLQQSMDEAQVLRNQVEEYPRTKHALLSDLEEKNTLINSLKADLATMSKLHRNTPSSVELTEKINDLETRLMTKTDEAEDAMDRLIDQMQKNKQLSSMVENLKIKIKSKEKSANQNVKDEPKQEPKQSMTFPSELESEPITTALPAPSPASRKRKLGYVANIINPNKLNSTLNPVIDAKENPSSTSEGSLPRKTILHPKLLNQEMNQEIPRSESQPLQLKSINVNQTKPEEEGNRRKLRERTSSSVTSKPGSTTSVHLLASIQLLRKKQQQQAGNVTNNLTKNDQIGESGSSGGNLISKSKPKRTNS